MSKRCTAKKHERTSNEETLGSDAIASQEGSQRLAQTTNLHSGSPTTTFLGPVPNKTAQYDIEISWPADQFFGAINVTVACNATDDSGRPLATVQPLPFAVVANPQLK